MADLKKASQGVWFGNEFVAAGTVLPAGHPYAAHPDFVDYVVADPAVQVDPAETELDGLRAYAADLGVKVDKRWKAERLREEIADAEAVAEGEDEDEDEDE